MDSFFLFYRIGIKAFQAVSNVTSTNFFFFVLQMAQQLAKTAGSGVSNLYHMFLFMPPRSKIYNSL